MASSVSVFVVSKNVAKVIPFCLVGWLLTESCLALTTFENVSYLKFVGPDSLIRYFSDYMIYSDSAILETLLLVVFACFAVVSTKHPNNKGNKADFFHVLATGQPHKKLDVVGSRESMSNHCIRAEMAAKGGDLDMVECELAEMESKGCAPKPAVFNMIFNTLLRNGHQEQAAHWCQELWDRGFKMKAIHFVTTISAATKACDLDRAVMWIDRMCEGGFNPNPSLFHQVMSCCGKVGDYKVLNQLLSRMEKINMQLDSAMYQAILVTCSKAHNVAALKYWMVYIENTGCMMNPVVWNTALNALVVADQVEFALASFDQMRKCGRVTNVTYSIMAKAFSRHGNWQRLEQLQKQMEEDGFIMTTHFLTALITAYGVAQPPLVARAESLVVRAQGEGLQMNRMVVLALAQVVGWARTDQLAGSKLRRQLFSKSKNDGKGTGDAEVIDGSKRAEPAKTMQNLAADNRID